MIMAARSTVTCDLARGQDLLDLAPRGEVLRQVFAQLTEPTQVDDASHGRLLGRFRESRGQGPVVGRVVRARRHHRVDEVVGDRAPVEGGAGRHGIGHISRDDLDFRGCAQGRSASLAGSRARHRTR